jgi:TonB-dependent SusC/RagA subfamily outer membrane receptor
VSNFKVSARALKILMMVPLSVLLACASSKNQTDVAYPAEEGTGPQDGKTIENMLASRFPGVTVTQVEGGALHIRIRGGSNSFYGSSEPLYIVDDAPLDVGPQGLLYINPYDIARIEVLKNPEDVGVYGVRGANGVIKITMKKPGKR